MQCLLFAVVLAPLESTLGSDPANASAPSFERDVFPILDKHCLVCHGGFEHKRRGELDLRTITSIVSGGKTGPAMKPGTPAESLIWRKIDSGEMSKGPTQLSAAEKQTIKAWIAAGSPATSIEKAVGLTATPRTPANVAQGIDREIDKRLAAAEIPPSRQTDDEEFLRRVYLDLVGRIPTAEQTLAFLNNSDPDKRVRLIDELLASPLYGEHWSRVWHNSLIPLNAIRQRPYTEPFLTWLCESLQKDRPFDAMARDILTAEGFLKEKPAAAFLAAFPEAKDMAFEASRVFLGANLECAECHNHPTRHWLQTDAWAFTAFFAPLKLGKSPAKGPNSQLALEEQKPDNTPLKKSKTPPPFSFEKDGNPVIRIPDSAFVSVGQEVTAAFLDRTRPILTPDVSSRKPMAVWLTSPKNKPFAEAAVNRLWAYFFGRGLVEPLDGLGDSNLPTHPAILESLAHEFRVSDHNLRHVLRCICNSKAYQRSAAVLPENKADEILYSHMPIRILDPEIIYAAATTALGVKDLEIGKKPAANADPIRSSPRMVFTAYFPTRDTMSASAIYDHGAVHTLRLVNLEPFNRGGETLKQLLADNRTPKESTERLYLAVLSRRPLPEESVRMVEYIGQRPDPATAYTEILWALLNSAEFVLQR